jgi:hypothetical protein
VPSSYGTAFASSSTSSLPSLPQELQPQPVEEPPDWRARFVSLPWIEALVAANEDIIACESLHRQCALVAEMTADGQDTAKDEILLASYMASLTLIRAHRDSILAEAPTEEWVSPTLISRQPWRD